MLIKVNEKEICTSNKPCIKIIKDTQTQDQTFQDLWILSIMYNQMLWLISFRSYGTYQVQQPKGISEPRFFSLVFKVKSKAIWEDCGLGRWSCITGWEQCRVSQLWGKPPEFMLNQWELIEQFCDACWVIMEPLIFQILYPLYCFYCCHLV